MPRAPPEGPPWKRRADDAAKRGKQAGWGGVARKGAGRVRDERPVPGRRRRSARRPADEARGSPRSGSTRARCAARPLVPSDAAGRRLAGQRPVDDDEPISDPSLRRAVGAKAVDRLEARLKDASKAFRRERFEEARKILRPLAEAAPTAESVRELLGLTYYRLGRWKQAVSELEAFRDLNGSTEQHPVLADCYRALGRHAKVDELWEELRGCLAERTPRHRGPHRVRRLARPTRASSTRPSTSLRAAKAPGKRPQDHHLRRHLRPGRPPRAGRRRARGPPALRHRGRRRPRAGRRPGSTPGTALSPAGAGPAGTDGEHLPSTDPARADRPSAATVEGKGEVQRSLGRRFVPLAAFVAVQLLIIALAPSRPPDGVEAAEGFDPGGSPRTAPSPTEAMAPSPTAPRATAPTCRPATAAPTAAVRVARRHGGADGGGATGGPAPPVGGGPAGDTSHCKGGRQFDPAIDFYAPPCIPKFGGNNGGRHLPGRHRATRSPSSATRQGQRRRRRHPEGAGRVRGGRPVQGVPRAGGQVHQRPTTSSTAARSRSRSSRAAARRSRPTIDCLRNEMKRAGHLAEALLRAMEHLAVLGLLRRAVEAARLPTSAAGTSGTASTRPGGPYHWDVQMSGTKLAQHAGRWWCAQLNGKPAKYAGSANPSRTCRDNPRKLGVISTDDPENKGSVEVDLKAELAKCGASYGDNFYFYEQDITTADQQRRAAVLRMNPVGLGRERRHLGDVLLRPGGPVVPLLGGAEAELLPREPDRGLRLHGHRRRLAGLHGDAGLPAQAQALQLRGRLRALEHQRPGAEVQGHRASGCGPPEAARATRPSSR